jgi:hypothetical protein
MKYEPWEKYSIIVIVLLVLFFLFFYTALSNIQPTDTLQHADWDFIYIMNYSQTCNSSGNLQTSGFVKNEYDFPVEARIVVKEYDTYSVPLQKSCTTHIRIDGGEMSQFNAVIETKNESECQTMKAIPSIVRIQYI